LNSPPKTNAKAPRKNLTASVPRAILAAMLTESEVLKQAMELPASQRCAIARRLLESHEPTDATQK
jgi:hypothetical protein